jgi:hypothetical protein
MYRTLFCTLQTSGDLANGSEEDDDDADDDDDDDDEDDGDDDDEGEYEDSVMEVQPDIIVGGEEDNNQVLQLDLIFFKYSVQCFVSVFLFLRIRFHFHCANRFLRKCSENIPVEFQNNFFLNCVLQHFHCLLFVDTTSVFN